MDSDKVNEIPDVPDSLEEEAKGESGAYRSIAEHFFLMPLHGNRRQSGIPTSATQDANSSHKSSDMPRHAMHKSMRESLFPAFETQHANSCSFSSDTYYHKYNDVPEDVPDSLEEEENVPLQSFPSYAGEIISKPAQTYEEEFLRLTERMVKEILSIEPSPSHREQEKSEAEQKEREERERWAGADLFTNYFAMQENRRQSSVPASEAQHANSPRICSDVPDSLEEEENGPLRTLSTYAESEAEQKKREEGERWAGAECRIHFFDQPSFWIEVNSSCTLFDSVHVSLLYRCSQFDNDMESSCRDREIKLRKQREAERERRNGRDFDEGMTEMHREFRERTQEMVAERGAPKRGRRVVKDEVDQLTIAEAILGLKIIFEGAVDLQELCNAVIHHIPDDRWLRFARQILRVNESVLEKAKESCGLLTEQKYYLARKYMREFSFSEKMQKHEILMSVIDHHAAVVDLDEEKILLVQAERSSSKWRDFASTTPGLSKNKARRFIQRYGVIGRKQIRMVLLQWTSKFDSEQEAKFELNKVVKAFQKDGWNYDPYAVDLQELCEAVIDHIPEDCWLRFARQFLRVDESIIKRVKESCHLLAEQKYHLARKGMKGKNSNRRFSQHKEADNLQGTP